MRGQRQREDGGEAGDEAAAGAVVAGVGAFEQVDAERLGVGVAGIRPVAPTGMPSGSRPP